jgi:hypothetical protein
VGNVFTVLPAALPVPANAGGVSAAVDVRASCGPMTFTISGNDGDVILVQGSPDGVTLWGDLVLLGNNAAVQTPADAVVGFIRLVRVKVDPTPGGVLVTPSVSMTAQPLPGGYSFVTAAVVVPAGDGVGPTVNLQAAGLTNEVIAGSAKSIVASTFDPGDMLTVEASADGNVPWATVMQLQQGKILSIAATLGFVRIRRARVPAAGPRVGVDGATAAFLGQAVVPAGGGDPTVQPSLLGTIRSSASEGEVITIRGANLNLVARVDFNGTGAAFALVNNTRIDATVPVGATTGMIHLLSAFGPLSLGPFCVLSAATLKMTLSFPALDPRITIKQADGSLQLNPLNPARAISPLNELIIASFAFPAFKGYDYTVRFPWSNRAAFKSFYLTSAASADGAHSIFIDATGKIVGQINGSAAGCTPFAVPYASAGSEYEMRYVYDGVNGGDQLMMLRINGAFIGSVATGAFAPSTGPNPMAIPTAFYLGSNLGATPAPDGISYFESAAKAHDGAIAPVEIVVMGDSTSDAAAERMAIASSIYYPAERWTRGGIFSLAQSGATIATQKTLWTLPNYYNGKASVKAFVIMIGVNDILANTAAATIIAALSDLTATVKASNPTAKVVMSLILPAGNAFTGPQLAVWTAVNTAISNGTVTGVDAVQSAANAILDDGTGKLKPFYDYGDGLHEDDQARHVIAAAVRNSLTGLAILP